ncbi:Mg-protoporphyrin IX methyl transferase [Caballeronia ptereochthonis]|uniref:Mg-protoporphyrin IX methyl transferase n=2 Tax=Caballeronia ptereochthonis TaxID=1777144 RepID=A0A158AAS7_9BURK|nr:Mg-protoporphyrin IX methyl transferase [Caballeronia ptereochthonis]
MKKSTRQIRESYDDFPYHSFAYSNSAPENLAAVAHLFGLDTPDMRNARVLELGCASGGNAIPFAVRNPKAHVVGIDLSEVQIEEGRRRIAALKLKNIELRALDLTSVTKAFGQFDYIVCHGLFSWVPEDVRQAILRICRENLSATGVAYVSYKTYPGWKAHEIVRDAMLLRAGRDGDIRNRLALGRGMIDFLRAHARGGSVLAKAIEQDHATIARADANYVAHDYLASVNTPCYFLDFVGRADAQGMTYVAEADPMAMFVVNYGDEVARPLLAECDGNQVLLEQYLDFVGDRSFRSTLLVHNERKADIRYRMDETRLRKLHIAASLVCADGEARFDQSPQRFGTPAGGVIVLDHAVSKAAALALMHAAPFTMSFGQLRDAARERIGDAGAVSDDVLDSVLTALIEAIVIQGLGRYRLAPVERLRENPFLTDAARSYPAHRSEGQISHTFNVWHEPVVLDAAGQLLLPYIDGKRTRADLLVMLEQAVKQGLALDAKQAVQGGQGGPGDVEAVLGRVLRELCA